MTPKKVGPRGERQASCSAQRSISRRNGVAPKQRRRPVRRCAASGKPRRQGPGTSASSRAGSEIKKVARHDPTLAADGAVALLERISPALEQIDSSSGAIGTAVNNAIASLVPVIADAPADRTTRDGWLERLWVAHEADEMP